MKVIDLTVEANLDAWGEVPHNIRLVLPLEIPDLLDGVAVAEICFDVFLEVDPNLFENKIVFVHEVSTMNAISSTPWS